MAEGVGGCWPETQWVSWVRLLGLSAEPCSPPLQIEDGWWLGRKNGRVGAFPSNFVQELDRLSPGRRTGTGDTVVAPGPPETEDEGWWEGECDGRKGFFPDNFVLLLQPLGPKVSTRVVSKEPGPVLERQARQRARAGPAGTEEYLAPTCAVAKWEAG
uniref:SH3 domain-containing protein n=1 Tax=Pelusios castaneus TaxID=367368 RepID=A0A8C8VEG3_9SAUR